MSFARRAQTAALLISLVGIAAACGGGDAGPGTATTPVESGGPLFVDNAHTTWQPVKDGDVFSDGLEVLQVTGSQPATLHDVQPVGGADTMQFLGARIGLPGRPDDFNQHMRGYPPRAVPARYQQDLDGTVLEPGKTYMLILGFKVIDPDAVGHRTGLTVSYESGGHSYQTTLPAGLVSCPPTISEKRCEHEAA